MESVANDLVAKIEVWLEARECTIVVVADVEKAFENATFGFIHSDGMEGMKQS